MGDLEMIDKVDRQELLVMRIEVAKNE